MKIEGSHIERDIKVFCKQIGTNPLLVQGAGGNLSWKDRKVMWIKASGTWLAEAESKDIFVSVNLSHLQNAIIKQDFSVKPKIISNSSNRPSIETLLHALMPHTVVLHLHAVEILAHLVKQNARLKIKNLVEKDDNSIFVDYFKPGQELAKAISVELLSKPNADVVFMSNHGVVIAGDSIGDIKNKLDKLLLRLKTPITHHTVKEMPELTLQLDFLERGYIPCLDQEIQQMALNKNILNRVRHDWALYPDHVVFLGAEATIIDKKFTIIDLDKIILGKPSFIFVSGECVYESLSVTVAQKVQLRCYYEVLLRQRSADILTKLCEQEVADLLDWDAEKFRINISMLEALPSG
jgi:rhamnose utilization protein RhaD (predicted bifunctional aldolase and dehydrogenase)